MPEYNNMYVTTMCGYDSYRICVLYNYLTMKIENYQNAITISTSMAI